MTENIEENTQENCTCNDEFVTAPCPVHSKKEQQINSYDQKTIVVDDNYLVSNQMVYVMGHKRFLFVCPNCNQPALFSHYNGCPNCLVPVQIKSKILTDYIRSQY